MTNVRPAVMYRVDFVALLERLYANRSDIAALYWTAAAEFQRLQQLGIALPNRREVHSATMTPCSNAVSLLKRCNPQLLNDYTPVAISGVGNNCLWRSVSCALYGTDEHHAELRARAAIEIAMNRQWYDETHPDYCAPFKGQSFIVCPSYSELCKRVTTQGKEADVMSVLALSAVTGLGIQMYLPPLSACFDQQPLTRLVIGRGVETHQGNSSNLVIMWSSAGIVPVTGSVDINHFVPLIRNAGTQFAAAPIFVADSPLDNKKRAADSDDNDDDNKQPAAVSDDDDDDDDFQPPTKATKLSERTADEYSGCGNSITPVPSPPSDGVENATERQTFKTSTEVYTELCGDTQVLESVPRGRKVNCSFLVDNTDNVGRKRKQMRNRFWDDCGVWDARQGRNLRTVLMKNNATGLLSSVNVKDGRVCTKKRVAGKDGWYPLEPQPPVDSLVTLCQYYATLKASGDYRKRVSWLESQPERALVEYLGEPPQQQIPHGLQRNNAAEYVRTKPAVLDSIKTALEHREHPKQVYDQHMANTDSFEIPRNYKQVKNLGQAVGSAPVGSANLKNAADDMQAMINAVQENEFVQSVNLTKGKSPIVIAYLPQQIQDMSGSVARIHPRHCAPWWGLTAPSTWALATSPL